MKLRIFHRTHYTYAEPVKDNFNESRLQPKSTEGQVCDSFILKILPTTRLSHYYDFYLNCVHIFEVNEPHSTLLIEATSIVKTPPVAPEPSPGSIPMSQLAENIGSDRCYDFLQASTYVDSSPEIWRLALDASADQTDVWQTARTIMSFIHTNFTYTPMSTNVHTHMADVLRERRGVCQDFAHVMLGMCRSLKIPARYVSGYLYCGATDQLIGWQATHAWCEVYLPGLGWRGLDPTNNRVADEHYVKLAIGRDYSDVAPVKGHYKGSNAVNRQLQVEVNVTAVDT